LHADEIQHVVVLRVRRSLFWILSLTEISRDSTQLLWILSILIWFSVLWLSGVSVIISKVSPYGFICMTVYFVKLHVVLSPFRV
jgi:hypothetical protein